MKILFKFQANKVMKVNGCRMVEKREIRVDQEERDIFSSLSKVRYERDRSVVVSDDIRSLIGR